MTVPFTILGLDHVVIRASDPKRLERFYVDVLGCKVEKRQETIGLTQLRAGTALIDLLDVNGPLGGEGGPASAGRNMDHICLGIDLPDVEALRSHLLAHGVEPGPTADRYGAKGSGPSLYVRDPEGNGIELKWSS